MIKPSFQKAPDENRMKELLTTIQPLPSEQFHQKMKQAAWQVGGEKLPVSKRLRFQMALAILALAALTALLATPQGRTWAQEVFQFFRRVNFTTIRLTEEEINWMNTPVESYKLPLVPVFRAPLPPEMTSLPECQDSHNIQSYACQVAFAETTLAMDLKEFPETPDGWIFKEINLDTASKTASIIYTHYSEHGGNFTLRQGEGVFQSPYWDIVPAEKVQTVQIGPYSGEYVLGRFTLTVGENAWKWNEDFEEPRLAWGDENRWYYIEIESPRPDYISLDQVVELAASLVDSPVEVADPPNPDSLSSIAQAEEYSRLDLKAPTILPLGYDFSYARYFSLNNEVHLHYEYDQDLVVYEWEGNPDDFEALADIYRDHEIVEVNSMPAFYGVPEAVSQYESSYLLLAWHDEALNYRLYFYFDPTWGGGRLNQADMVSIAESMGDINDYKANQYRPYEYIAHYEKALGFEVREFSATPKAWSYTNTYAYTGCLVFSYSAIKENGELIVIQCKTDQELLHPSIPASAIEEVSIGNIKGQYIIGNFEYDAAGTRAWKLDAPMRQLHWKEDGNWIQIVLSGDSTVLYDREDLISYAELLH